MTASDHLNYRQVEKYMKRANAGGGFTVKAYGPDAGTEPENVHLVGGHAQGLDIYPPEVGHDIEATTEQGMAYVEQREGALRQTGMNWGGWHGGNRIALDVSKEFPRNTEGTAAARRSMVEKGEESIATLGRRTTGGTATVESFTDNPFYGRVSGPGLNTERREWTDEPVRKRRQAAGSP